MQLKTKPWNALVPLLWAALLFTGIYYEFEACLLSLVLLVLLAIRLQQQGGLTLRINFAGCFAVVLPLLYLLSAVWAVDSQMALLGAAKFLPVGLFALLIMQYSETQLDDVLSWMPATGAVLVVLCFLLSFVPVLRAYLIVNGRQAGTFEYPNSYALFLLLGLLWLLQEKKTGWIRVSMALILLFGIMMSGSRTIFVLFLLMVFASLLFSGSKGRRRLLAAILAIFLAVALLAVRYFPDAPITRLFSVSFSESTLLGRLLYWKDALPVLLSHPFGLGYQGYFYLQGSFQTGVYSVNHAHNEFLQLFLDVGWIGGAALIGLFGYGIWKNRRNAKGILLLALGLHCAMDFDLQFIAIYLILLLLLPWSDGVKKEIAFPGSTAPGKKGKMPKGYYIVMAVAGLVVAYVGLGNVLYYCGSDAASMFYPKNTQHEIAELTASESVEELEERADAILSHNRWVGVAWDAKARAAFSDGTIQKMITYKETALKCQKYDITEYEDYLYMLSVAIQLYQEAGDEASAEYCMEKALSLPDRIEAVLESTDELAWKLTDQPELEWGEEYRTYLQALEEQYSR